MTNFWIGLAVGTVFGLAIAIVLARLAGSAQWIAGLLGFSQDRRKVRELEKRLEEKDRYIRRAVEAFKAESGNKDA